MREVQGGIIASAFFIMFFSMSGLLRAVLHFISPITGVHAGTVMCFVRMINRHACVSRASVSLSLISVLQWPSTLLLWGCHFSALASGMTWWSSKLLLSSYASALCVGRA